MKQLIITALFFLALAAQPASAQTGEIMTTYHEYQAKGYQYRIVLVWNTKTGKALRYYYDNDNWYPSTATLPENPLGEASNAVGEIMMDYHEYQTDKYQYRIIWVWNTKTGQSARYYYDNDQWHKSSAALPDNPLGEPTNAVGTITMDYHEYQNDKYQYRIVLVTNTQTGQTVRYYYDNDQWHQSTAALPADPLGQ